MKYVLVILISFSTLYLSAQVPQPVLLESSDPRATDLLEKSKEAIESYQGIDIDFSIHIEIPDEEALSQKGTLLQHGDQYRLDLPDRLIICDGKSVWSYLKEINEVQITEVASAESEGFNTPLDWLKIYESEDFIYALTSKVQARGGESWDQVEFKSTDRQAEYSKIRLSINGDKIPKMLELFYKDGVKMTLHVDHFTPNYSLADNQYVFDASQYPNVHVEDLRF